MNTLQDRYVDLPKTERYASSRRGKLGSVLILLLIVAEFLTGVFGSPIIFHSLSLLLIIWGFTTNLKIQFWQKVLLGSIPLFALQSIVKDDFYPLIQVTYYFLGIIAYQKLAASYQFNYNLLPIKFLFLAVLPLFFLFCFVSIPVKMPDYIRVSNFSFVSRFIPLASNEFRINIGPPNFTKHFTGDIGLICFLSVIFLLKNKSIKYGYLVLFLSLYFVVFSGARTSLTALICCCLLIWINNEKIHPKLSFCILALFIVQFYSLNEIIGTVGFLLPVDSFVGGILRLERINEGITSGRDFLWGFHLHHFLENPFIGGLSSDINVSVGSVLANGEIAEAGSESVYTTKLAQYGILGIIFPILHLFFFLKALLAKNTVNMIWCVALILGNVFNSTYGNIYGPIQPLMYFLIFANYPNFSIRRKRKVSVQTV